MVPTQEWLDECLDFWKVALALTNWNITIRWVSSDELEDCYGEHKFDILRRCGSIRIRNEPFRSKDNELWNPEHTVIHELLHLHLTLLCRVSQAELNEIMEERFINDMAAGFLNLREAAVEAFKVGKEKHSNDCKGRKRSPDGGGKKVRKSAGRRRKRSSTKGGKDSG